MGIKACTTEERHVAKTNPILSDFIVTLRGAEQILTPFGIALNTACYIYLLVDLLMMRIKSVAAKLNIAVYITLILIDLISNIFIIYESKIFLSIKNIYSMDIVPYKNTTCIFPFK